MDGFKGRSAVIAGRANGIGFATAREFARRRANVVLADVDKPALDETSHPRVPRSLSRAHIGAYPPDHHPGGDPSRLPPLHLDERGRENLTGTYDQRPAPSDQRSPAEPWLTIADASHRRVGG